MGVEQDNADFPISTVFENGRLLVGRRQRASEPTTARRPNGPRRLLRDALFHRTDSIPLLELHPDRDSTCLDCADIEEYLLLKRELCARTTKRRTRHGTRRRPRGGLRFLGRREPGDRFGGQRGFPAAGGIDDRRAALAGEHLPQPT
ncbi:unnamed protein product [Ixodes pacificus]